MTPSHHLLVMPLIWDSWPMKWMHLIMWQCCRLIWGSWPMKWGHMLIMWCFNYSAILDQQRHMPMWCFKYSALCGISLLADCYCYSAPFDTRQLTNEMNASNHVTMLPIDLRQLTNEMRALTIWHYSICSSTCSCGAKIHCYLAPLGTTQRYLIGRILYLNQKQFIYFTS